MTLQTVYKNVKVCNCIARAAPFDPHCQRLIDGCPKRKGSNRRKTWKKIEVACQPFNEGILVLKVVRMHRRGVARCDAASNLIWHAIIIIIGNFAHCSVNAFQETFFTLLASAILSLDLVYTCRYSTYYSTYFVLYNASRLADSLL